MDHPDAELARAWALGWCVGASNVWATNGEKPLPQNNPYEEVSSNE